MSALIPLSDFDFEYPDELVASVPTQPRDSSKLLVIDRISGALEHAVFRELPRFLRPGDCLVLNRTKVMPCRLIGRKSTGGRDATSAPSIVTRPDVGSTRRLTIFMVVVLPHPDGPTRTQISPARISSERSVTAVGPLP